jgi:SAM-dependent methyltransferase
VVICSHVLEHVPDDGSAMREIRRALRPGGVAAIMIPFAEKLGSTDEDFSVQDPAERQRRFGQHDHCRVYGRDFPDRLRNAGFRVAEWNAERSRGSAFAKRWLLSHSRETVFDARPHGKRWVGSDCR